MIKFKNENGEEVEITEEQWEELIKKGNEKNAEYKRHLTACKGIMSRNYNQKYGR